MATTLQINDIWKRIDQRIEDINEESNKNWQKLEPFLIDYMTDLEKLFDLGDKKVENEVGSVTNVCFYVATQAVHYNWCSARRVYQIGPARFKNPNKAHTKNIMQIDYPELKTEEDESGEKISANNSSPPIGEITFYDCPDYTLLTELKSAIDDALTIIETDPDWFTQEKTTIAEWDEVSELYEMVTDLKQAGDDRFDIRTLDARRYIEALSIKSIRRVMDVYHAFLKLTVRLSTKQLGKFMRGKSRHSPVEPQTREEAIRKGFSGKPCPECKSWRYEEKVNSLGSANIHPRDEDLRNIIPPTSFYRCYSCGFVPEIELPEIVDRSEVKRTE